MTLSVRTTLLASATLLFAAPQAAFAQRGPDDPVTNGGQEEIVVTALIPRSHTDILGGTSVLSGEELTRSIRSNIGDTLAQQPGVSSTSFGPGASRPILRGFAGDRIRLLTDGIGSFDASATSVDHAVAINPLLAERIEVLHGPAALLYGSSAVGGVVNIIDGRIPSRLPEGGFDLAANGTFGSAARERSIAGKTEIALGGGFVFHADGTYLKTRDLRTGGAILGATQRAEARASDEQEIRDLANLSGRLPNSAMENWNYTGGLTFIADNGGSIGFSVGKLHSSYGVPIRYLTSEDHDHEDEGEGTGDGEGHSHEGAEQVAIVMNQTRADLRAVAPVNGGFLDQIRLRAGWADYEHAEVSADDRSDVHTRFFAQGLEARLDLIQTRRGAWDGAIGGQLLQRSSRIEGEEKFLPRTDSTTYGLFTLQSLDLGDVRLEAGGRFEHNDIEAAADDVLGSPDYKRSFDTVSGSLGASYRLATNWRVGLNLSRSERAPTADELFARGNHAGTQAFELGDPTFRTERGWGVEATLHGSGPGYHVSLTGFYNRFSSFIFDRIVEDAACQAANGGAELEFPCFQFSQAPARYLGFEAQADAHVASVGGGEIHIDGMIDYVRATVTGYGPAPRIPPLRILGGVSWEGQSLTARVEAEHDFAQDRVAGVETTTPSFTLVNASLAWKLPGSTRTSLLLSGNNLFDVVARRHASVLKDYAPLAGRDIRVTLSVKI